MACCINLFDKYSKLGQHISASTTGISTYTDLHILGCFEIIGQIKHLETLPATWTENMFVWGLDQQTALSKVVQYSHSICSDQLRKQQIQKRSQPGTAQQQCTIEADTIVKKCYPKLWSDFRKRNFVFKCISLSIYIYIYSVFTNTYMYT